MPNSIIKKQGILQQANDWKLQADLDKKLQSQDIVQTSLKPDIVIQSAATSSLSLSNWQLLGRKDARVHMKWRKQSKQTYQLCAKNVDGNLAVPSRGGLSGLSSTISMDHIELPRHCRKTTQSCSKSARTSCRKSIQLAMVEKRPEELEAIQWGVVIIWSLLIRRHESVMSLKDRMCMCRVLFQTFVSYRLKIVKQYMAVMSCIL